MRDFGYTQRARKVNEAQAAIHAAFKHVVNRNDLADPATRRWLDAVAAARTALAQIYPDALQQVADGVKQASELDVADVLDFLEADPIFFRSGYFKEKLLRDLKRRKLSRTEARRLQRIILTFILYSGYRREFLYYCRVAANVDAQLFREELARLEQSDDWHVRIRANWVLAALEGKWLELKRASRLFGRGGPSAKLIRR